MSLQTVIKTWDGNDTEALKTAYREYVEAPDFADQLIALLAYGNCQPGASWLLKYGAERQTSPDLSAEQLADLLAQAGQLQSWQSRLHLLQILPHIQIPAESVTVLEYWLRSGLQDSNKFVRAWSYGGFYLLSEQYPQYREEADAFIRIAMRDEVPSVKARLRQLGISAS
ncbi:hypothetical protein [Aliamphritea ceti]|uniref:hypothetical protein n=1 Tax=Aliamphritea ceti TaxID=1524258 RepID=UPI0021C41D9B|nr:hypothetical protein [Aliamphritea ceti]